MRAKNGKKHAKFDPVVSRFDGGYAQLWLVLEPANAFEGKRYPRNSCHILLDTNNDDRSRIYFKLQMGKGTEVVRLILLPFLVYREASPWFLKDVLLVHAALLPCRSILEQ